ncbi:hypothetical protein Bhyg_13439 [Pseudolycoriella hygida]|uniref:Uncharacterized protein n=1 Tax=Pseudolycoriella hygida TaxID=35572 RepID=A0A9Q0RWG8_9DIPT|nr:hypothetical protein Bhyg_13439 [Pseudolycoriella hygida]
MQSETEAIRYGCDICTPHDCSCGKSGVNSDGIHGLSCQRSAGRFARHCELNTILKLALSSAQIPSRLEPPGLNHDNNEKTDGVTLIPWSKGRMDRRKLHKANGQATGKNKENAARTRANNRAAQQDNNRDLDIIPEVARASKVERLERDKKRKRAEMSKRKPFVTDVKRGVFLDSTNYIELNKKRRMRLKNLKPAPVQLDQSKVFPASDTQAENVNENMPTVPNVTSVLNTTFVIADAEKKFPSASAITKVVFNTEVTFGTVGIFSLTYI